MIAVTYIYGAETDDYVPTYNICRLDVVNPPILSFGTAQVGKSSGDSPKTLEVQNVGDLPLTFPVPSAGSNPSLSQGFVSVNSGASACPSLTEHSSEAGILSPGASCTLAISFVPEAVGSTTGSLALIDNALNAAEPAYATQTLVLTGNGLRASQANLIVTGVPISAQAYGATFTVGISGGSGTGAVSFTATGACSASGASVTVTRGRGTCSVTATKAADANFLEITSAAVTVSAVETSVPATVPIITSISPPHATAGSSAMTVTVRGANFLSGAVVQWNGSPRGTTVVDSSQISATITTTDLTSAGTVDVAVVNPAPGGGTSNSFKFSIDGATSGASGGGISVTAENATLDVQAGRSSNLPVTFSAALVPTTQTTATCLNLPIGATCSYDSTSQTVTIQTSASTPPGNYQVLIVFTVTQQKEVALSHQGMTLASLIGMLPVGVLWAGVLPKKRRVLLIGAILLCLFLASCGGGGGGNTTPGTPPGSLSTTVQTSTMVMLNVH